MTNFSRKNDGAIILWAGDPDCQAGHDSVLCWLQTIVPFFLSDKSQYNRAIQGNLGEGIAFYIGNQSEYINYTPFPINALNPLSKISKPEIDIVWIYFGSEPSQDFLILQEVKTTTQPSLSLADTLVDDYDKLFGTNPAFTLHTRLQAINNIIQYSHKRPDLCARVLVLAAQSPKTSPRIQLVPTLIHDLVHSNVATKLHAVRTSIITKGWSWNRVTPWGVGLGDLDARLIRLAMGQT